MESISVALTDLARLETDSRLTPSMQDQIEKIQMELRFLKMFCRCLHRISMRNSYIKATLGNGKQNLYRVGVRAIYKKEFNYWNLVASKLLEKVERCKPNIRKDCLNMLYSSFPLKFSASAELLEFLNCILRNLTDLVNLKADAILDVKLQILALEGKLQLFSEFLDFTVEPLEDVRIHIQAWAYKAACLSILYWVNGKKEEMEPRLNFVFLNLAQMVKPCAGVYLGVLKTSKPSKFDTSRMGKLVSGFTHFLLENLVLPMKDGNEIIHEGLILSITFLRDPPKDNVEDRNIILTRMDDVVNEATSLISSLSVREKNEDIAKESSIVLLCNFLMKVSILKAELREIYVQIPDSSLTNFPKTNGLGFMDFLLGNLKELLECRVNFYPFTKHQIVTILEELESLRPFLNDVLELQNQHQELNDLWTQIISVAYKVEHVTDSALSTDALIWYDIMQLSNAMEEIQLIKTEVKKIRDKHMCNIRILSDKMNSSRITSTQAKTSRINEVIVGFTHDANTIINRLKRGSKQLDIVPIVGMPGLGKTTLSKKVYNDPSVQHYFNKFAWSCISQVYRRRQLLLDICSDLIPHKEQFSNMTDDELAEQLYKCLKGQRYLIVLDDIWDIRAWHELKESLPDDQNGSRIMFTSRIREVSLHMKPNCDPHYLQPLSYEESWELLQHKLFDRDICPPILLSVGKQIVKGCRGLPLSIVLIAGVLAKADKTLDLWKQIEERLRLHIANEGCMDIIELSYKDLPDVLKPCFLYFGAFREDQPVKAHKLIRLWIAEGFIPRTGMKSLEDLANEYLMDLIDRSLVIVAERVSNFRITKCKVHDLLRDFCLKKSEGESFLKLSSDSHFPLNIMYEQYRLCIDSQWSSFVESEPNAPHVRSLLFSGIHDEHPDVPSFFIRFKLVRVLDLQNVECDVSVLEEIMSLVHLRYLAVMGAIDCVPSKIHKLQNLEVFRLKSFWFAVCLPKTIWEMKRLRHVHVDSSVLIPKGDYELEQSSQLDNMETFSFLEFSSIADLEEILRRLPNLRKLGIEISCPVPSLRFLSKLESLHVCCRKDFLLPSSFDFPSTLRKLTLNGFNLTQREMSAIGELHNLEILKLLSVTFRENKWDVEEEEFATLKYLKLNSSDLAQWSALIDPFPCLQQLVLDYCYELEELPSTFGGISTLEKIEVRKGNQSLLSSARKILQDQQDLGNEGFEVLIHEALSTINDGR